MSVDARSPPIRAIPIGPCKPAPFGSLPGVKSLPAAACRLDRIDRASRPTILTAL